MRTAEAFVILYDLQDASAWGRAHYHRDCWGRSWTDVHWLDSNRVALVFRSGGEQWRPWEEIRMGWILESEAA